MIQDQTIIYNQSIRGLLGCHCHLLVTLGYYTVLWGLQRALKAPLCSRKRGAGSFLMLSC